MPSKNQAEKVVEILDGYRLDKAHIFSAMGMEVLFIRLLCVKHCNILGCHATLRDFIFTSQLHVFFHWILWLCFVFEKPL